MEEINLKELFEYFKERILTIFAIILAILVLGCIYSIFLKTPMYQSKTTLILVSDSGVTTNQTTQSDVNLNKSLVTTYSAIVTSDRIVDKVIENLSLDYTTSELKSQISVSTTKDTEIITIVVRNADKALATDIANEVVNVFSSDIKEIYKLQNVSVVDRAKEATNPYNINVLKDIIIYLAVGIALALAIIFIIYYFDTTIKSAEVVENKFGLPVYGIIPKVKRKEK